MPDTGAPWEIPYLDGTELVRNYPDFSEDLADAVALGLTNAVIPGIGSNVVQTVKTDTFTLSASTSTPFTDVTGMSVTITPSSATSKILVILQATMGKSTAPMFYRLTGGNASDYVGDADGSRQRTISQIVTGSTEMQVGPAVYLDSPATTSPVTYQLQFRSGGETSGVIHLNRSGDDSNSSNRGRGASSITAIEVSA